MQRSLAQTNPEAALTIENETLGLAARTATSRPISSMHIVWGILLLYVITFVCFWPKALTNFDEVSYVRQAVAFASGAKTVDTVDAYTGQHKRILPSDYPPATSALMAPFAWIGGWRGTFFLGLLAVVACVLFTARWILESGGSPLFALVILGYVPTVVMARTAMSDIPSACLVAAGLWLFWPDNPTGAWRRLLAGFIAGASLSLREPNPILFAFFFTGALLRRERHLPALISGTIAGVACRFVAAALVYGDPLFVKVQFYGFTGLHLSQNLVMYLTGLLIMVPGGLLFALGYRGRRWPELVSTVAIFFGMFLVYNYNGGSSRGLKQWMLTLRFLIPLLPIVAFAMAHTCPRWAAAFLRYAGPERARTWRTLGKFALVSCLTGMVVMFIGVNWRSQQWSEVHQDLVQALYANTNPTQPVVIDIPATNKFLNELHGQRMTAELTGVRPDQIRALVDRYNTVQIVFFDRDDSDYWVGKAKENESLLRQLTAQFSPKLRLQQRFSGLGVLQIWAIENRS